MDDIMLPLQEKIELLKNATKIEKLEKGYSPDKKYVIHLDDRKLLLRISHMEGFEKRKTEFQILNDMQQFHIQTPLPIDFGKIDEFNYCYNIYSYIEGIDAKDAMPALTEEEQFKIGTEEAPSKVKSWYDRAMEKHYRYLSAYKASGVKIKNDEKIIDFIEENKSYIKNRSNRFQHDDFHPANIIVRDKEYAGVIDFGNFDWGDPIHDFVKIALFQREISVPFSIGQIEGYYENHVPDDFWLLYSIYCGMVVFSSVVWSLRYSSNEFEDMINRLYVMLEDHKYFEKLKPEWYEPSLS